MPQTFPSKTEGLGGLPSRHNLPPLLLHPSPIQHPPPICLGGPVNFGKETNCSATISVQKPMVGVLGMMVVEHRVYRPVGLAGKFSESVRLRTLLYTLLIGHRRYPMVPSAERSTALASPTPAY